MTYTMDLISIEHLELSALLIRKTALIDLVYTLASANIDQSAPNLAKISTTNRSRIISIMNPLGLEQTELFALELGKLLNSTWFTL